jgi:hypothetical protein
MRWTSKFTRAVVDIGLAFSVNFACWAGVGIAGPDLVISYLYITGGEGASDEHEITL